MEKRSKIILTSRVFFVIVLCFGSLWMQAKDRTLTYNEITGKELFEGVKRFENSGPSCISCHSVDNNQAVLGGLLAKNLTDVYSRMGEGISSWLSAPPFPAMASSYQNNPLTDKERAQIQAYLKYVNEVKEYNKPEKGFDYMLLAGVVGMLIFLILINFTWFIRKRTMVKQAIFDRQVKASDAKF
ncbi:MAG TPA: hypothetical protein PK047_00600 [Saprospiraceae bacterium]|jgi:hypothetical protein|nr:hypothetical protein [Saprospiraceae bacterium]HRO07335.1 hypothetical protein [Saprospiraceae bacterium]HRP40618.1 hypothetical protein [Saprospiraceae bacterium]